MGVVGVVGGRGCCKWGVGIEHGRRAQAGVRGVVSVPGNPRVNNCYPYPYPSKPLPSLRGKGYRLGG